MNPHSCRTKKIWMPWAKAKARVKARGMASVTTAEARGITLETAPPATHHMTWYAMVVKARVTTRTIAQPQIRTSRATGVEKAGTPKVVVAERVG